MFLEQQICIVRCFRNEGQLDPNATKDIYQQT